MADSSANVLARHDVPAAPARGAHAAPAVGGSAPARRHGAQCSHERVVGDLQRLGPREPRNVGALTRARLRVVVAGEHQVTQIEMHVLARRVDVDMEQVGTSIGMGGLQACLLAYFTQDRLRRRLARVDVTAGLQPQTQALVAVQDGSAPPDHHGRRGDVGRVGVLVQWLGKRVERSQELLLRRSVAGVDGLLLRDDPAQVGNHRVSGQEAAPVAAAAAVTAPATAGTTARLNGDGMM